tara:strand:+ start:708 stop:869 length:162 start_codon:yes stop_codon:yes gene_type:complete
MEPDKKLLKKVEVEQKAIKAKSIYREEAPNHKDRSATSSEEKLKALTDLGLNE